MNMSFYKVDLKLFSFGNKLISVLYYMLKSMYSFVIKLIVAAGIFSVSVLPKHRLI